MGIGDKWRSLFSRKKSPDLRQLHDWVAEHQGVEGYIEPRTNTNPTSLLLVDRAGDHARAPLRDPDQGRRFCERHGIPVYDAQVIGYPKRMRDFERRSGRGPAPDLDREIADLERRLREIPPGDRDN
ncbi:MAG: oxidoreductase [Actinomycetota bacterium]